MLMFTSMAHKLVQLDAYSNTSVNFANTLIVLPPEEREIWKNQSYLGATLALAQINLDWPLIGATISFWDPASMVFCFGEQELSPTIKELKSFLD